MKREYFAFFASWYDAICELDDQSQLALYKAIMQYAWFRTEPEITGVANMVWKIIRPILEAGWKKFENGCNGGCPKGTEKPSMRGNQNASKSGNKTETKPKQNQIKTESKPNQNQDETETKAIKNKEERIKNEELRIKNNEKNSSSISINRNCVQNKFAPGCGNGEFDDVVRLFNSTFKRFAIPPVELDDKRRNEISVALDVVSGDMATIQSVFDSIAKDPNNRVDPTFDNVMSPHPAFAQYWVNAMSPNQTTKKS